MEKSALRRAELTPEVIRLRSLGFPAYVVAKRLGTTNEIVREIWAEHISKYVEAKKAQGDDILAETLAKLDVDEAEAGAAWERSKRDKKRIARETGINAEGKPVDKRTYAREGRLAEASYLQTRNAIRDQRNKILGHYAPTKVEGKVEFNYEDWLEKARAARARQKSQRLK